MVRHSAPFRILEENPYQEFLIQNNVNLLIIQLLQNLNVDESVIADLFQILLVLAHLLEQFNALVLLLGQQLVLAVGEDGVLIIELFVKVYLLLSEPFVHSFQDDGADLVLDLVLLQVLLQHLFLLVVVELGQDDR